MVSDAKNRAKLKNLLKTGVKFLVTGLLIWFLATNIDLEQAASRILEADPIWLAVACLAILTQLLCITLRWRALLAVTGAPPSFGLLLRLVFEGMFFNQALPSSVGGDAVRIYRLARIETGYSRAVSSVLIDRMMGLLGLVIIGAAMAPIFSQLIDNASMRNGGLFVLAAAAGAFCCFLALDLAPRRLRRWRPVQELLEISRLVRRVITSIRLLLPIGGITLISQFFGLSCFFLISRALGLELDFLTVLAIVPVVVLIIMVPITIAGWGLREGAMVLAFAQVGVAEADALAMSILFGFVQIVAGLPGGLLWFISSSHKRSDTIQTGQDG